MIRICPLFETAIPALERAFERLPAGDPLRARLRDPLALLARWDRRWAADSEATSLAAFWAD